MANFIISYDLIKRKDYPTLWTALEDMGGFRCLRSVWLVSYETDAEGMRTFLRQFIDEDDKMIVVEFDQRPAAWKCLPGTKAWLDERF